MIIDTVIQPCVWAVKFTLELANELICAELFPGDYAPWADPHVLPCALWLDIYIYIQLAPCYWCTRDVFLPGPASPQRQGRT
jgi:hypothetical protein